MTAGFRYVVRNLSRRRMRTVLGALGMFLTIALLTAMEIGLDSISTSYTDLVALQAGKADVLVQAEGSSPLFPDAFEPGAVEEGLADNPHLLGLAPRLIGYIQVEAPQRTRAAMVAGIDPARERQLDISGLFPEPTLTPGTCAISEGLAGKLGLTNGSAVTIRFEPMWSTLDLRVETIIERQLLLPQEVKDLVIVNVADARSLLSEPTRVHLLAGAFRSRDSYYAARDLHASVLRLKDAGESIAAALGLNYEVRLPKAQAIAEFQNFAAPLRAIFGVFALLALSITGVLIYSIVSVAVEERIREYAILRTLGGKRRQIVRLVLVESITLCLLGVLPGTAAGVIVAQGILKLVELILHAGGGTIPLEYSTTTLGLTFGAGVLLSIGSALIPAVQAIRWPIVDALDPHRRGRIEAAPVRDGRSNRPLLLIGVALSALAIVVFFVLPTAFLSGNPSLIGTVVLCLLLTILLGFTLMALGALPWVERVILIPVGWLLGPSAELAGKNLSRYRRRHATTALMFILSVSLVIFAASLVVLFSRTSMSLVEHFNGADIRLQSSGAETTGLKEELARVAGVQAVSEVRFLRSRSERGTAYDVVLSDLVGMKHLWIVPFGIDAALPGVLYLDQVQYANGGPDALSELATYQSPRIPGQTNEAPPLILSLSAAHYLNLEPGDLVQMSLRLGGTRRDARFRIIAVCNAVAGFPNFRSRVANAVGSGALIPLSEFVRLTEDVPDDIAVVRYFAKAGPDDKTRKAAARQIRDQFDVRHQFGVKSAVEQKEQARILYWVTQVLFGLLLAVAMVIAVFALIASMATAVIERRWEVGVLKALGLRRGQLFRMFLGETVVLTLAAGVIGGAIGFTLAYLFGLEVATLIEVPVVFTLPYITFLATFIISLIAGAVAAYLPTRQLLRKPAAEILRLGV